MEEDIKILKELVANEHGELLNCWDYGEEAKKAIENIINRLEQDERVIEEMAKYMATELYEYQLDDIYAELNNCCGMERDWCRGEEKEKTDILTYFRKKCE